MKSLCMVLLFLILVYNTPMSAAKDSFSFSIPGDITSFDATKMDDVYSFFAIGQINEGLFGYNKFAELVPILASRWTISSDKTVYTISLKPDVYFHNGKSLSAEDVVFSLDRIMSPEAMNSWLFESVVRKANNKYLFEAIDSKTVKISLESPYSSFLDLLASVYAVIYPKSDNTTQAAFGKQPIGTGPYQLVEWQPGKDFSFKRFDRYHGGKPAISKAIIGIGNDQAIQRFNHGTSDMLAYFDGNMKTEVARKGLITDRIYQYNTWFIATSQNHALMNNKNIRKALACTINKTELVKILGDKDSVANNYLPPGFLRTSSKNPRLAEKYDCNLKSAQQLIKAQRIGNKAIEFGLPNKFRNKDKLEAFFTKQFRKIGLQVKVQWNSVPNFLKKVAKGDFPIFMMEIIPGYADPQSMFRPYFHSRGSLDLIKLHSKTLDNRIEKAQSIKEEAESSKAFQEIDEYLTRNHFIIPLYHENLDVAYSEDFKRLNFSGFSLWYFLLKDVTPR